MTDLFDHAAAQAAKKEGMAQSELNANTTWSSLMLEMVRLTCLEQLYFNADDVFDRYDAIPNAPTTHDARAFGPVMTNAARAGYCEKADVPAVMSRRKSLHASPIQVWRSKLYRR